MIDLVYLNRLDAHWRYQARTERMSRSGQLLQCATTDEGAAITKILECVGCDVLQGGRARQV